MALALRSPAAEINQRTESLLSRMTLSEKIGQLTQIGADSSFGRNPEDLIRQGQAGSVLWTIDSSLIRRLQTTAVTESRLRIPLLFGFDVIHGFKTAFPVPIAMAASWDPALVERVQTIAAHEAAASGINWTFGPMVDIARDARWGRMVEGAGEDPYLGAAMARAQVLGFQGPQLGTPHHILGSVKHFAGYGAADGGRDYDSSYLPDTLIQNVYLPPFKAAIDAGVGTVMSAYMALNDVPASGNRWLLQDVLRRELGFHGFVISDSYAINSLIVHGLARDEADAADRGLVAGVDMDMGSETYLRNVERLVRSGRLPIKQVDQSVRNVLAIKFQLGLFECPFGDFAAKDSTQNDPAHRAAARTAAQRSLVLLRNEMGLLPLSKSIRSVAVIGPLGDSAEDIKGPWTADWTNGVSVLDGIRRKIPGAKVTFVAGGDMQRSYALAWDARQGKPPPSIMPKLEMNRQVAAAVAAAKAAEAVVLVLGERRDMCGEDASSSSLGLDGNQQDLLEAVAAQGKPVVLVLLNGRPLDIAWAAAHVPAILEAWFPGCEGGNGIADALFGDSDPGGKLPVTWPRSAGQCPVYYNHNLTQEHEDDPQFTSRYANADSRPLYPFGFGLSYTDFAFSRLTLDRDVIKANDVLTVAVDVANTGQVAGDEVVQLYLHQRAGRNVRPVRELKGFERLTLAAGETRTVRFTLERSELRYWDASSRGWLVEPGPFDIWVGGDSRATLHGEFRFEN